MSIAVMRKYMSETSQHQRWLEDKLRPHRATHLASLLAAEARYKEIVESEPDPEWYRAGTAGYYSKYWKTNESAFIGYLLTWREMDARRDMEAEIEKADQKFNQDTQELYAIYESRTRQTLERLGR